MLPKPEFSIFVDVLEVNRYSIRFNAKNKEKAIERVKAIYDEEGLSYFETEDIGLSNQESDLKIPDNIETFKVYSVKAQEPPFDSAIRVIKDRLGNIVDTAVQDDLTTEPQLFNNRFRVKVINCGFLIRLEVYLYETGKIIKSLNLSTSSEFIADLTRAIGCIKTLNQWPFKIRLQGLNSESDYEIVEMGSGEVLYENNSFETASKEFERLSNMPGRKYKKWQYSLKD